MADIYLDSCLIISLIEGNLVQQRLLKKHLVDHVIYSSELARLETRIVAIRNNNQASLKSFEKFFAACEMVDLNRAVFEQATLLRVESKLKTPDALHLAAAIQGGCQAFWTEDKQLKTPASQYLEVIDLAKLGERSSS
jgi:uncharacterized protein